jgi:hypothetical protein
MFCWILLPSSSRSKNKPSNQPAASRMSCMRAQERPNKSAMRKVNYSSNVAVGGSMFLRNVGDLLLDYKVSHPKKEYCSWNFISSFLYIFSMSFTMNRNKFKHPIFSTSIRNFFFL